MLLFAVVLFLFAVFLLWQAARRQRDIGLPAGRVIYTDTRNWGPVEQPLYDAELGLTGKPDYLVESGGKIIPVEVKSSRIGSAPYDAHIFQLAAYCMLVHRHYGKRPPYGILHYPNRTFAVDYTPRLEAELLQLLQEMHNQDRRKELERSHASAARCSRCGYRQTCDQRLL
ncbi:MAG: CRISPR-associated protein Cas4 [Anaerolineales bacterium]|jgi:CRISPR-associated exonuclease Cas4|nr:CRISPR-associated protein Cas4 [Anaerolineales bacterium]